MLVLSSYGVLASVAAFLSGDTPNPIRTSLNIMKIG